MGLVSDSSSIIVNAGSTGLAVARRLADLRDLTVATNNVLIPSVIDPACLRELYLLGGRVRIGSQATVGALSLGLSPNGGHISIAADIALISVGAISADRGFSTGDPGEAQMMGSMMERADITALMVDSSKFEKRLFAEVAPLAAADYLITDAPPPAQLADALADAGVQILVPSGDS
ncbi:DeoR/GlpR family DNA-binding transcription regulator [Brachybacterium sacelli]|uniref:DeoR/GlpR family DNA-binding transcription regulator n=1 Tax=Brachybacterium sacelli TaxID=173364 RepID=UPI003607CA39